MELTDAEKQWIIKAIKLAPISGNASEVQQVLQVMANVINKLTPIEKHENGEVKEEELAKEA